ncbi:helix-turn-helix domain-containing protein [Streptomyces aurantiacus]|uniref:helix-turn-helix domain-containing protein n=1 Tax=Streptomyces aurantiacus TaxID=47760 RepID=UPI0027D8A4F2|nr:helix-turn-helix domain-containing protein [Streptomyces aurantiacus]
MGIADSRLTDPDLSPAALARELRVSVRTLQRAFAATETSVTAYIRHQRLERARIELAAPCNRPTIADLAAHWQFADSSHFIRTFKKQYGQTPTQYARTVRETRINASST